MFKKETHYSVEYEKENPPKSCNQQTNFKLSMKHIKRFE